jgi:short-subunit dehydrogenase
MDVNNKVVLITGASSGIGAACARVFGRAGAKVSLAARRTERLQGLAEELKGQGIEAFFQPVDITNHDEIKRWVDTTVEHFGRIDVLINNAGVGCVGKMANVRMEQLRDVFDLNFFAAIACVQEVVPHLRKQRSGHIVNISSIIGKRSVPEIGGYCATKFALNAATDALRVELKGQGIGVSTVCPGLTDTEFTNNQLRPDRTPPYRAKMKGYTPERVAKAILRAVKWRHREIHLTAGGKFLVWAERISPCFCDFILGFRSLMASGAGD